MSGTVSTARARADAAPLFYVWMSGACLAISVIGFVPSYFLPVAAGTFTAEPVVHIHGAILFSWVALFFAQSLLVARGRVTAHRSWGVLGVAIATAIVFIVTTIVSMRISQASQPDMPPELAPAVRAFEWPIVGELLFFASVFVLAIVNVRRPGVHKRLLVLATVSMLAAPIARLVGLLLAPAADAAGGDLQVPPVSSLLLPGLIGDLLIVAAMVHDWRSAGRVHPVYAVGGACLLAIQLTAVPVAATPQWQGAATAIGRLAG